MEMMIEYVTVRPDDRTEARNGTIKLHGPDGFAGMRKAGRLAAEIVPVTIPQRKGDPIDVDRDEHPRETTVEAPARL